MTDKSLLMTMKKKITAKINLTLIQWLLPKKIMVKAIRLEETLKMQEENQSLIRKTKTESHHHF